MTPILILLVEDEPLIRMDVESVLIDAGFEVLSVASGKEAIRTFNQRSDEIKALITDIRLGEGPDGWQVGKHARQSVPALPVVYVSGDRSADWASHGVPHSVMLAKPFAFLQLLNAVATLLNGPDQLPS